GLALLRLAQGRVESACAAMRRLQRASRGFERQRLLPACVEIFLAAGETDDAQLACAELEQRAQELRSEMLTPAAAQARGAVELAAGNAAAAVPVLRSAFEGWRAIEA